MILAIDSGNIESAYVVVDETLKPLEFAKVENDWLNENIPVIINRYRVKQVAIEHVACYGMAVGKEVFDTCVWIGRFTETTFRHIDISEVIPIYRKDEKLNICQSMKTNDSNIRRALIDRFAQHDFKNGKGTKKEPDFFFGFKADIWSGMAVAVTYYDLYLNRQKAG